MPLKIQCQNGWHNLCIRPMKHTPCRPKFFGEQTVFLGQSANNNFCPTYSPYGAESGFIGYSGFHEKWSGTDILN